MYEPTRGGTRGGQAEFKWSDVSADKDREVRNKGLLSHSTRSLRIRPGSLTFLSIVLRSIISVTP